MIIRLEGKTKKGKERIRRWGNEWRAVIESSEFLRICAVKDQSGDYHNLPDSFRRIHRVDDPDFDILETIDDERH